MQNLRTSPLRDDADLSACPELATRVEGSCVVPKTMPSSSSEMQAKARVDAEAIQRAVLRVRSQNVLLDADLAKLYGVDVRALNQAVARNADRFPSDFMFKLTAKEAESLRSQSVILDGGRGRHRKYLPHAFTEQGVAMLSSVLRSQRAVRVNIEIMRAFVQLRRFFWTRSHGRSRPPCRARSLRSVTRGLCSRHGDSGLSVRRPWLIVLTTQLTT